MAAAFSIAFVLYWLCFISPGNKKGFSAEDTAQQHSARPPHKKPLFRFNEEQIQTECEGKDRRLFGCLPPSRPRSHRLPTRHPVVTHTGCPPSCRHSHRLSCFKEDLNIRGCLLHLSVLGIEARALWTPGKSFAPELSPAPERAALTLNLIVLFITSVSALRSQRLSK